MNKMTDRTEEQNVFATPRGFRDVMLDEAEQREHLCAAVGAYFAQAGYRLIETPAVERAAVLAQAAPSVDPAEGTALDQAFRFVDVDGDLLALRSDVTLPIVRVAVSRFAHVAGPYRLRYCTEVYRERESLRGAPRAIRQLGIEFLDAGGSDADAEVLDLALGALEVAGLTSFTLGMGHVGIFRGCVAALDDAALGVDAASFKTALIEAAHRRDFVALRRLADSRPLPSALRTFFETLPFLRGDAAVLDECAALLDRADTEPGVCVAPLATAREALAALRTLAAALQRRAGGTHLTFDLSLLLDMGYYTGLVFEVFAPGGGEALGSGGRYDNAATALGRPLRAAGFAYDVARLQQALRREQPAAAPATRKLRIAIPKGSLYQGSLDLLARAGIAVDALRNPERQLTFETDDCFFIIAKPTDVAIYVATGAVDCGIGGKDILVEADYPLLEMVDLGFGGCRFAVAQPAGDPVSLDERALQQGIVRVATKYPHVTAQFFARRGIQCDIVKLNGNIELAPLIGLADCIVDITATGTTLRENDLRIVEEVEASTARFVANPGSAQLDARVGALARTLYSLQEKVAR